eukprot:SAG31_NODE_837_length_11633_cov_18.437663_1_plen_255_part_10
MTVLGTVGSPWGSPLASGGAAALALTLLVAGAAGQVTPPPNECTSMHGVNHFADAVTALCCDEESDGCDGNGMPARCDVDCAPAILEMQTECGPFLLAHVRWLGALKDDLAALVAACPANIVPDPTACATMVQLNDYAAAVTNACCDGGSNACLDGVPTQCDDHCAAVLLPMQADCSAYFEANNRFLAEVDDQINAAAALCTAWRPSPAPGVTSPPPGVTVEQFSAGNAAGERRQATAPMDNCYCCTITLAPHPH